MLSEFTLNAVSQCRQSTINRMHNVSCCFMICTENDSFTATCATATQAALRAVRHTSFRGFSSALLLEKASRSILIISFDTRPIKRRSLADEARAVVAQVERGSDVQAGGIVAEPFGLVRATGTSISICGKRRTVCFGQSFGEI